VTSVLNAEILRLGCEPRLDAQQHCNLMLYSHAGVPGRESLSVKGAVGFRWPTTRSHVTPLWQTSHPDYLGAKV
jgi:hypothetical protein